MHVLCCVRISMAAGAWYGSASGRKNTIAHADAALMQAITHTSMTITNGKQSVYAAGRLRLSASLSKQSTYIHIHYIHTSIYFRIQHP